MDKMFNENEKDFEEVDMIESETDEDVIDNDDDEVKDFGDNTIVYANTYVPSRLDVSLQNGGFTKKHVAVAAGVGALGGAALYKLYDTIKSFKSYRKNEQEFQEFMESKNQKVNPSKGKRTIVNNPKIKTK